MTDMEIQDIRCLRRHLDSLDIYIQHAENPPLDLLKKIICGSSTILKIICNLIPNKDIDHVC